MSVIIRMKRKCYFNLVEKDYRVSWDYGDYETQKKVIDHKLFGKLHKFIEHFDKMVDRSKDRR